MKHTTPRKTDAPIGALTVVADFLPPPAQLVLKDDGVKITLSLSKHSVDFFKTEAAAAKVPYQKMIRNLVDAYVDEYAGHTTRRTAPSLRTRAAKHKATA